MMVFIYVPAIFVLCTLSCQGQDVSKPLQLREGSALLSPQIIINADSVNKIGNFYLERKYQGIPGIERAANGRLWATWYGGGEGEGIYNYIMLATSADDGNTWSDLKMVIDPDGAGKVRAFDPCLWRNPQGRLWLFWAQSYELFDGRAGVWAMVTKDSNDENPVWSQPRRIANGIMLNKPVVLKNGQWLLPCTIWNREPNDVFAKLNNERFSNVIVSKDNGLTFSLKGHADVPGRHCDEHMIVELKDGRLWMLVRTNYGIGQSFSSNKGKTWTKGEPSNIAHATARFFINRLSSGNLLLIKHGPIDKRTKRNNLTAYISKDDGKSWLGGLILDERSSVSYPDAVEADGVIYTIYDYSRHKEKEILMVVFTEDDVLAQKGVSDKFRTKIIVNKAICE
jgi:predicted neuraminidase